MEDGDSPCFCVICFEKTEIEGRTWKVVELGKDIKMFDIYRICTSHKLHEDCLYEYLNKCENGNTCPICKKYIVFCEEGEYEYKGEMFGEMKYFYIHESEVFRELRHFYFSSDL